MNFEYVYDSISQSYSEVESLMGDLYRANGRQNDEMIQTLGSIAKRIIVSQMSLVEKYADKEDKDRLMSALEEKYSVLDKALHQDQEQTRQSR